eukprot:SAG31_NODE_4797_length_2952_cov_6.463722_3_plen_103_part_00
MIASADDWVVTPCHLLTESECQNPTSGGDPSRMSGSAGAIGERTARITDALLHPDICCVPLSTEGACDADEAAGEICCEPAEPGRPGSPESVRPLCSLARLT